MLYVVLLSGLQAMCLLYFQHMFLVLELCEGGELADALKAKEHFDESCVKTIMKRLSSAVSYLHKNGKSKH